MRRFLKVIGILCILAVGMVSCGGKHSDGRTIKLPYSSDDVISFVELMDTLCTVQLEDSPEAILSDATKIIEYDDKFFILDLSASKIKVFDESGKYLYSIGSKGNGAGEYAMLFDFTINTDTGEVVMLAQGSVVYVYDEEGKFKEHKKVSDAFFLNITYVEGQYVFSANHSPYNEGDNAYLIHTFNQQFEEIGKYIPSLAIQVPDAGLFGIHLKSTGRNAYYMDMFTQKLYEIGQNNSEQLFDFFFS
ncbi:MAG: 6-bladed beta-propeller, partial [Muribaculaceae bacterium]|nr:6-bladed beta-propeller [Muribaculaceae bacterium]